MNSKLKKILTVVAGLVLVGSGLTAMQGTSSAESSAEFRLSSAALVVGTVCVITDVQTQCTGRIPNNTSRVYTVRYNNPDNWYCVSKFTDVSGAGLIDTRIDTNRFSRNEFKECMIFGSAGGAVRWILKRPDGSQIEQDD